MDKFLKKKNGRDVWISPKSYEISQKILKIIHACSLPVTLKF